MPFYLLNPWMLIGLAALAVPVIIHLLNRRRYDVVDWGAMQFLQISNVTRRRIMLRRLMKHGENRGDVFHAAALRLVFSSRDSICAIAWRIRF